MSISVTVPELTEAQVRSLQLACNQTGAKLVVDGQLGPKTATAMLELLAGILCAVNALKGD